MDPIAITVRYDLQGDPTPLNFVWEGRQYQVESTGRRWQDQAGKHVLVMVPGGHVFELVFDSAEARWFLKGPGPQRMVT
ncbi:MAG: hypothetical protein P8X95_14470 [Anaerolineales bacterium]|jgi:hypothetical protein